MFKEPNLKVDKTLLLEEINVKFDNIPGLNFNTSYVYPYSIFHYNICFYEREDGSNYYIFTEFEDCTMFIMNCNEDVYDILSSRIKLNDNIEIWQTIENNNYQIIPNQYRHFEGYGGSDVINIP